MKHSAFNGAITFDMGYRTLETDIISANMQTAVPFQEDWPIAMRGYYVGFTMAVPTTKSIDINYTDTEGDDALTQLADFWQQMQESQDYVALWEAFKKLPGEIADEWWEAFEQTKLATLFAPLELQPDGAEVGEDVKKKGSSGETK